MTCPSLQPSPAPALEGAHFPSHPSASPGPVGSWRRLQKPAATVAVLSALLFGPATTSAQQAPESSDAPADPPVSPEAAARAPTPTATSTENSGLDNLHQAGGLTADTAATRAVETAPSMARAEAAVAVAEAAARQTWQALFPRLELSARYTRLSDIDQPDFGGGLIDADTAAALDGLIAGVDDPEAQMLWRSMVGALSNTEGFQFPVLLNQYGFRATMSYPVSDLFFTILPAYRAQESAVEAQQAQLDVEQRQVALRAREAFYAVVRARAAASVAGKAVEQAEANETRMATLVEGGAAPRVELLRVQAQAAQARVGVAQARAGVAISEQALRVLLHMERTESVTIGEDLSSPPPPLDTSIEALTERALDERVEVNALRRAMAAREQAIRAELGRRYPQLLLQANLDYANPNQRIVPSRQEFDATWDISLILRWSPNDYGTARQRIVQAEAQIEEMRQDMNAIRDGVRIEIEQAAAQYEATRSVLAAAQLGLEAAEENRRVRFEQLEAGAAVTADLVNAETDLTRARLEVVNAAIDLHLQNARLRQAAAL